MGKIAIDDIRPDKRVFHNVPIDVYQRTLHLDEIDFWTKNNRTLFSFEILQKNKKKPLQEISIEDITSFIAEQPIHKLSTLADSIKRNGVQVPLIIRDDGKLLDGNRRYFACQWLKQINQKQGNEFPDVLTEIPVMVIRKKDITHEIELKILAEANFIKDLKEPWPLDAQARAIEDFYNTIIENKKISSDDAISEVVSIFGITKSRANSLLESLALTKIFIEKGKSEEEKINRRSIIQERFVYFWEFVNKAIKRKSKYDNENELKEVTDVFFQFMAMENDSPLRNVKQVEPLAHSIRDKAAWSLLKESKVKNFKLVINMINEKKEVRKAQDKIRVFKIWLKEVDELDVAAMSNLIDLKEIIDQKVKGQQA